MPAPFNTMPSIYRNTPACIWYLNDESNLFCRGIH